MIIYPAQGGEGGDPDHSEPGRDRRVREALHGARRRQEGLRHRQRPQELPQGNNKTLCSRLDEYSVVLSTQYSHYRCPWSFQEVGVHGQAKSVSNMGLNFQCVFAIYSNNLRKSQRDSMSYLILNSYYQMFLSF